MKVRETRKIYFRPFLIGATIVIVLVLHFLVSQIISFESVEEDSAVSALINPQPFKIKPEIEPQAKEAPAKPEIIIMKASAAAPPPPPPAAIAPKEKHAAPNVEAPKMTEKEPVIKKKALTESKAERLRRAEKILTGI